MIKSASSSSILTNEKHSSMSAGAVPSNEYLIQTIVVGATPVASVTFDVSAYAGVYRHLMISGTFRDTNGSVARLGLRINGVTDSNYMTHVLFTRGTGITSEGVNSGAYDTQIRLSQDSPASSTTANTFGSTVVDFLDAYSTSKFKTVRALSGFAANENLINLTSGFLNSTSAINSITLFSLQGTALATNSRFSVYGVTA